MGEKPQVTGQNLAPIYRIKAKDAGDVTPGGWYFGVTCSGCGVRFAVLDNPAQLSTPLPFSGSGRFQITCPCGAVRDYPLDAIRGYRAG